MPNQLLRGQQDYANKLLNHRGTNTVRLLNYCSAVRLLGDILPVPRPGMTSLQLRTFGPGAPKNSPAQMNEESGRNQCARTPPNDGRIEIDSIPSSGHFKFKSPDRRTSAMGLCRTAPDQGRRLRTPLSVLSGETCSETPAGPAHAHSNAGIGIENPFSCSGGVSVKVALLC